MTIAKRNEHIRKRPGMYLWSSGSKGVIGLVKGLILDAIRELPNEELLFHFSILADNEYRFEVKTNGRINDLFPAEDEWDINAPIPYISILRAISARTTVEKNEETAIAVLWSFDLQLNLDNTVDYSMLVKAIEQMAFLYRSTQFLITDNRKKYHSQNYFAHPEGLVFLYQRYKRNALGTPAFELSFDGEINDFQLELYLGYRTDWYPAPIAISFANEIHTVCGGSLVDGILEGLLLGCELYFEQAELSTHQAKSDKLQNGLILVCAVKGSTFKYDGGFKERLVSEEVKELAKELTKRLTLSFIERNPEKAHKFLWRFDERQLGSKIM